MSTLKVPFPGRAWPAALAIVANLAPLLGVAFWGWSAFTLIFLYWLENLAIGARTLLAMAVSGFRRADMGWQAVLALCGFFALHYGMFSFVHGMFVVTLFGDGGFMGSPFDAVAQFARAPGTVWGLASIALWQVVQFVLFLARGEGDETTPMALMSAPYPRVIVLHITILAGGMLVMALGQPVAGLVVMALLKAAFDAAEALGRPLIFPPRGP